MTCVIGKHGHTTLGRTTVPLIRGSAVVILRNVPADICDKCSEYFLDEAATSAVLKLAGDSVRRGAEVEVVRFAA
ncbi:MAG: type II toxin-antitoxin system MqsA family antitoxin [Deltaproteobacteria bacterium]|nr:type II toxin-antitoxin system MqsA family antitoxin [Deltaproteobacteria bacterium]